MPGKEVLGTLLLLGAVFLGLAAGAGHAGAAAETPSTDDATVPGTPGGPATPETEPVTQVPTEAPGLWPEGFFGTVRTANPAPPDIGGIVPGDGIPVPVVGSPLWRPLPIPL